MVVEGGDVSILGKDTAVRLGVLKLEIPLKRIKETGPFAKIRSVCVKFQIDDSVKPIYQPLRRIPVTAEKLVERKLQEGLERDIIEEVKEYSP